MVWDALDASRMASSVFDAAVALRAKSGKGAFALGESQSLPAPKPDVVTEADLDGALATAAAEALGWEITHLPKDTLAGVQLAPL